jgi:hypothetical protein
MKIMSISVLQFLMLEKIKNHYLISIQQTRYRENKKKWPNIIGATVKARSRQLVYYLALKLYSTVDVKINHQTWVTTNQQGWQL